MRVYRRTWQHILPLAIALCLLLSAGLALADNQLVVNPYAGVDWDQFTQHKANLHTHTTESGSGASIPPSQAIDEYHERDYSILALTDHDRNTWPWQDFGRDPAQMRILAVSGNELSCKPNTGALLCQLETEETDLDAALGEIAAHNGLAVLYHLGRYWEPPEDAPETVPTDVVANYADIFNRHDHLVGMEIINCGNRYPHDRLLWDRLLAKMMPERPVHGFANDDMHAIHHLGNDWTVFPLAELTEQQVREALRSGVFYAASVSTHSAEHQSVEGTPVINRISHDEEAGTLTVEASVEGQPLGDQGYRWIADGEVLHEGPTLQYLDDDRIGNYARLELVGSGGTAFTNAFGFREDVAPAAAESTVDPAPEGTFTVAGW